MTTKNIKLLDVVALTVNLPKDNLWRGQVGTIVKILVINKDALMNLWVCFPNSLWCYNLSQLAPIPNLRWRQCKCIRNSLNAIAGS